MARLFTGGFEFGHQQIEGLALGGGTAPTWATDRARTGTRALKMVLTNANTYVQRALTFVSGRHYYLRGYINLDALPTGGDTLVMGLVGTNWIDVYVTTTGAIKLQSQTGVSVTSAGGLIAADTWYRLELHFMLDTAGTSDVYGVRLDGATVFSDTTTSLGNTLPTGVYWGIATSTPQPSGGGPLWIDDIALNDNQGADQNSWPDSGKVVLARPVADLGGGTNPNNWTKPGGATTNRHTSLDNVPPTYSADSTSAGAAENMVRNPTNAASDLTVEMTDYTTLGIGGSDVIKLVQPIAGLGSSSATDTTGSLDLLSNPDSASASIATFDNGIASATVTTWPRFEGTISYSPSVTKGTRPQLRLSRTAANRTVMSNALGLVVEYDVSSATTYFGATASAYTFGATINGAVKFLGQTAFPITFVKDVAATKKTFVQIASPFTFGIATAGIRQPLNLFGATAFPITFAKAVSGSRKAFSQTAFPITFAKDVNAIRKTFGQLLSPYIFGKSVAATKKTFGQTALPITVTLTVAGIRVGLNLFGATAFPITFAKDVSGQRKTFSQIAVPLTFAKDVSGRRKTFGVILFPITFTKEAVGHTTMFGQLSAQTLFGKETAARRKTFGQIALPLSFLEVVAGRKQTYGQTALPISVPIYVDGFGWLGPQTYFGSFDTLLTFNKQVAAIRKTFGQITVPYFLGEFTQGFRKTFSSTQFPLIIDLEVEAVHVGAHGLIELDLILTTVTNGKIKIPGVVLNEALALYLGDQEIIAAYAGSEEVWRLA